MGLKLSNNAISSLASSVAAAATSIVLKSGDGAKFPSLAAGDYFPATISKPDGTVEIVRVTARSADTLTVTRAQEGTTALAFDAGSLVEVRLTAGVVLNADGLVASAVSSSPDKAAPADADKLALADSASSFSLKTLTWANLKTAIASYIAGVSITLTNKTINAADNTITLTSGNVTSALGYTPYSNANPNGYITGITSGMVTGALGYTPPQPNGTGASGTWPINISGNAANGGVTSVNGQTGAVTVNAQAFSTGTLMLFQQTAAPTGWTKQTTHNDKALRVVSGTASSGGSVAFSTMMSGSYGVTTSGLSAGATTLSTTQIPSHSHLSPNRPDWTGGGTSTNQFINGGSGTVNTGSTGGGSSHSHAMSGSATVNLAVQYVDLIIASKD